MANTMFIKDAAKLWNISERRVSALCKNGKIKGAIKQGNIWLIPINAEKPTDGRTKSYIYNKNIVLPKLPLPIGVSDYRLASTKYYYVDKTMMIKDLIDEKPIVSLFTRPRRFGKTLTMDMLRVFFEISEEDTSIYFKDKAIWQYGKNYTSYQGQFPVIFLTFKDIKCSSWNETYEKFTKLLSLEFMRHEELGKSSNLSEIEKEQYFNLCSNKGNSIDYQMSLQILSLLLYKHYNKKSIIIIDEYDTPIQKGYVSGFYEETIDFMRNFFSGGLKDNPYLSFGFLTGILRVAKESIFSGLNNLKIFSILDEGYSQYFGFTNEEVKKILDYYDYTEKYNEVCEWYDGYRFGNTDIFNPWSVINYISDKCHPKAFWQATSSNDIVGNIINDIITKGDTKVYNDLINIVNRMPVLTYIDTSVIYPQIKNTSSSIYSFLLVTGYLKVLKHIPSYNGEFLCEVTLPNKEVSFVYNKEILQKFNNLFSYSTTIPIEEALYLGDCNKLKIAIETLLMQSVSFFDTLGESFYHGFMLGLCALFGGSFVTSNRESGNGRFDIQLKPKQNNLPGILIELKAEKNCTGEELKKLSKLALKQIIDKKYDAELISCGITLIYKYGVAFSGKNVEITME